MVSSMEIKDREHVLARFMGHVKVSKDLFHNGQPCWEWQGCMFLCGNGRFYYAGSPVYAHIISFVLHGGQILHEYEIDHLCKIPHCVHPAHLEAVPPGENQSRVSRQTDAEVAFQVRRQKQFRGAMHEAVALLDRLRTR